MARWIVAGTSTLEPYPCRCREPVWSPGRNCGSTWCPCWDRLDGLASLPFACCALRQLRPTAASTAR